MSDYRLYVIGPDGHFKGVHELSAGSDAEAVRLALKVSNPHGLDLWQGARRVRLMLPIAARENVA